MAGRWKWTVSGTELEMVGHWSSSGPNGMEDSGTVRCELMGAVLEWLAARGPFWDMLDTDEPVTFTIEPVPEEG